jgi:excisionase family DNA binding protein
MATDQELALSLEQPLMKAEDAAVLLNVKPSWVRDASREGRLPHIRVGRHFRYERMALERWAAEHRIENEAARSRPRAGSSR